MMVTTHRRWEYCCIENKNDQRRMRVNKFDRFEIEIQFLFSPLKKIFISILLFLFFMIGYFRTGLRNI